MNKAKLKAYAPAARIDFIQAVTQRANLLGLTADDIAPVQIAGDVALINGRPWPASVAQQRELLMKRIQAQGFAAVMEAEAYGWFNRFAALRFMELHGYLDHGYRVLSNLNGVLPEILENAVSLDGSSLPGLDRNEVVRLKLAGDKDNELYRLLLTTQCNALAKNMGFLFETLGDETELLLPDNLLNSDSIIAKLVAEIPEEDWTEVEIIGWLYQFYISEKKDQVIGKVVKSEDIPAATQLFTPNWIVQYLVQNSVGRLWLMANPHSTLAQQWPYYITPAEQTPEVQAQLDALIQTRVREDGDTLNPESITVLDPACGSGHILVVAYDVLKAIYLERGYQPRAIPRLILEKNLFGLDIDDRAAQMAGFALLMKARADDRRLFTATDDAGNLQPVQLKVRSLQESKGLSVDELSTHLAPFKIQRSTIAALVNTFEHAKTFGSLIRISDALKTHLTALPELLCLVKESGDMYANAAADDLSQLVQQALILAMQFDSIVANPPYMGGKGMNPALKEYAKANFPDSKSDLFAMFIERGFGLSKATGFNSLVTMQSWMFLSSFELLRSKIIRERMISTLTQIGYNSFPELNSKIAQACAFCIFASPIGDAKGVYINLNTAAQSANKSDIFLNRTNKIIHEASRLDFELIPGNPIAYWISTKVRHAFSKNPSLSSAVEITGGMTTGDNEKYLRLWHEVSFDSIGIGYLDRKTASDSKTKWFPYNKGGPYRRWYGNNEYVVNWQFDGKDIQSSGKAFPRSKDRYFSRSITYSATTSLYFGARHTDGGFLFDAKGSSAFIDGEEHFGVLSFFASNPVEYFLKFLNPTVEFQTGDLSRLPLSNEGISDKSNQDLAKKAIGISKLDWDSSEISWDFKAHPIIFNGNKKNLISESWAIWAQLAVDARCELRALEVQNNRTWIAVYNLQSELAPDVPESQITLVCADREKDCQRLISYAIGCMMGRYSLDEPGLIYAHAGNVGFEPSRYATFHADADGIVPITNELWFADDACSRIREFLRAVWGADTLEENMAWLAESLGTKASETPDETIRRYLTDKFYKDHLQTYKKRPIYWLFSSGKQGAFECLVYLHRYNEGTLARMRNEYVIPLSGKFGGRAELLQNQIDSASTTSERTKLQKELDLLKKKQLELTQFDEQLRHYADQRISLDLDDGVKVNYGKFGHLLAEVKAITGGASDD
jgi:type II restriction/modification system DNA methylase subunit YeeA